MASSANIVEGIETSVVPQSKLPVIPLLIALVVAILFSVALLVGAGYYLVKSGHLSIPLAIGTVPASKGESGGAGLSHALVLEPMVVNLADEGGKAYLRLGLTLRIEDAELKKDTKRKDEKKETKGVNEAEAAVRDTALEVLGRQTSGNLLGSTGKEQLKAELKVAMTAHNRELKIDDVYFTEFLVQR